MSPSNTRGLLGGCPNTHGFYVCLFAGWLVGWCFEPSQQLGVTSGLNTNSNLPLGYSAHKLVSWCFEPSQPQRITSRLNTNFTLSPSYSFHKSSYHKSCFVWIFFFFKPIYIPRALNGGTWIRHGDLFYSVGPHRNHVSAIANTGNIGRGFRKNVGKWTGRVEISKEEIPAS